MTKFLIIYISGIYDVSSALGREKVGTMSGICGSLCNALLCIVKFVIGTLTGSVAITADAFNNLSDAASNVVTIAGAKLANKPVDKEHPFGHGRLEYISALIVSFIILLMGFELGKSSIEKIIKPEEVNFSIVSVVVLVIAISVKLWMDFFNKKLYKKKQKTLNFGCLSLLIYFINLPISFTLKQFVRIALMTVLQQAQLLFLFLFLILRVFII